MADHKTKQAFIVQDFTDTNFNDTGVERQFEKGKTEPLPEGVFLNYQAAGIARDANDKGGKTSSHVDEPTADDKGGKTAS